MKTPLRYLFASLAGTIRTALEDIAESLPAKVIPGPVDPLVTKYHVTDDFLGGLAAGYPRVQRALAFLPALHVRLHHFHRGDADRELHSHPWRVGVSLLLVGGYREERGHERREQELRAGDVNVLWPWTMHRVDVAPGGDAWTLFVHDGHSRQWGFLVPREEFVSAHRPAVVRP